MKFSLVTPVYNMEAYLAETIQSVLAQAGDFDIEYILVNDGSTDSSEKIILDMKKGIEDGSIPIRCRSIMIKYIFQQNQGMYCAINNGFAAATGDIYCWIGGDDRYAPGAFQAISEWFTAHPQSQWVKGMCGLLDKEGNIAREGRHRIFHRTWLAQGIYGRETYFVEQESVFWKPELWKRVAPIPTDLRAAGDYWLWINFAQHTSLESIPVQIAYFRIRPGQVSGNKKRYQEEQRKIAPHRSVLSQLIRLRSITVNRLHISR
ncbi:MAG TPA: glycosyltransferase [Candidatus Paceibacterota bacterium]|nr:glycosyltransferase [Candidatus Paceibacterota bacterium]